MEVLAWTLIALGALAIAAYAVHITRRHRRDASCLARSIHRIARALLAAGLLPARPLRAVPQMISKCVTLPHRWSLNRRGWVRGRVDQCCLPPNELVLT